MHIERIVIIGLGGIGRRVAEPLVRTFLYAHEEEEMPEVVLVDRDEYEARNHERQPCAMDEATDGMNKAEAAAVELRRQMPVEVSVYPDYVTPRNAGRVIKENDLVVMCVDNFASRKLVADRCEKLQNVILISGGNELTDGNVQVFIREDGHNVTANIDEYHPEIADPQDVRPDQHACLHEQEIHPQLIRTNNMVAAIMLNVIGEILDNIETLTTFPYGEVYFDVVTNKVGTAMRESLREEEAA